MNKFIKTLNIYNEVTKLSTTGSNCKLSINSKMPIKAFCQHNFCKQCIFCCRPRPTDPTRFIRDYTHITREAFNDTP